MSCNTGVAHGSLGLEHKKKKNGCHLHYIKLNQLYIKINFIGIGNLQQMSMNIK